MGGTEWLSVGEVLNLEKYPIQDLTKLEAKLLIQECKRQMNERGACELPEFATSWGVEQLAKESEQMANLAFRNAIVGNAYLDEPDAALPLDHVRRMTEPTELGAIAYDQFPKSSLLARIYEWDPLMYFVGAILELPRIYRYADPMGGLNLAVMQEKDYLRWHFDQTDFVTSLSIQDAETGGDFEFVPMIRNSQSENYEKVRSILKGSREGVQYLHNKPGTLVLFQGRHSLHRVSPIQGPRLRFMGLFGFDSKEGTNSSEHLRKIRYGRTTPLVRT